jgi:hypothetical protein
VDYRKIPLILAHNELPVCAVSCLEELGWLALGGSEAGKDPTRPDSSLSCVFLSSAAAFAGSAACRSWGAGSNFSAMANPPFMRLRLRSRAPYSHDIRFNYFSGLCCLSSGITDLSLFGIVSRP